MANLLDAFEPKKDPGGPSPSQDFTQSRVVPFQPEGIQVGYVFMGAELGYLQFIGEQPRAGDLVAIIGQPGAQVAVARSANPQRDPIFAGACKCKCPGNTGLIFHLAFAEETNVILAINAETGVRHQIFGKGDLWWGRGLAVNPQTPFTVYVLDDRRVLSRPAVEGRDLYRGYFSVVKFEVSGTQYARTAEFALTDGAAGTETSISALFEERDELSANVPNFNRNAMSVINGALHISLYKPPARYLRLEGSTFVTHTLQQEGANYARGLRGQIVTIPDKPAPRNRRYVIADDEVDIGGGNFSHSFQLLEIDADDNIVRTLDLASDPKPQHLATMCNRLLVLHTNTTTFINTEAVAP